MSRALWVSQVFPRYPGDPWGGFLLRLARELPRRGVEIDVVAPGGEGAAPRGELDGVRVRRFDCPEGIAYGGEMHRAAVRHPWRFVRFLDAFRAAASGAVRELRPDLVHAHWWVPSGWISRSAAAPAGVPLVVSLHGTDMRLLRRWPVFRPLARGVLRASRLVLPVSSALDDDVDGLGIARDRREILPMPADGDLFRPGGPPGTGPHATFLVVARLTAQKRVADVLAALHEIAPTHPQVLLGIAGDGPERSRLESRARELGVTDRVTFHGQVSPARLAELYRGARALVLPSREEGYGLVVVEAALCGIPAIATRSGGLVDLVDHERSGLLVDVDEPRALSAAMIRLADDPELAWHLGSEARSRAAARTAGPVADRLVALYRRIGAVGPSVSP